MLFSEQNQQSLSWFDEQHCRAAQNDPNAFATFVLRDELGQPIVQSPWHLEWQALCSHHPRVLLWSHVESGKTNQIAVARVLFELSKNPNLRVVVLSNTFGMARDTVSVIGQYIQSSPELRRVAPHLRRARGQTWTKAEITVERDSKSRDPSVRACGIHGNILGARIDLLVVDDALDYENTLNPRQREDFDKWFVATLEGRLTKKARVWWIGNAWHREDAMHLRAASKLWVARKYPVVNPDGTSVWSDAWPSSRIDQKRLELGPVEFSRQMMCVARSDEDARFKISWIQRCLELGEGRSVAYALEVLPKGYSTYTGVDLAVARHRKADLTAIFTIVVAPDGTREPLDCVSGRWSGPEIIERIIDVHERYHSIVLVENNAAQDFLVQFAQRGTAVPIRPFTTGKNKAHPEFGLESIATEMSSGKWRIPSKQNRAGRLVAATKELQAWVNDMLYYDPSGHTPDRLMASWFAREGARQVRPKLRRGRIDLTSR